jgi:RNA polymerase sigma-70 factor (ECF subfamily)
VSSPQSEDNRWFAEEVQPHESTLRAWLRHRFPTLTDTDDLVQESYARLFRARETGLVANAKNYLFATARNAALDIFRHEQVLPMQPLADVERMPLPDSEPGVAETVSHDDELALLAEAIRALPERCREVLVLRKLHGLSQKQISEKLGISENTVAAQASFGVRRCMEYFRERQVKK